MNTTKITSIILCQILLLSIVGFSQETTPVKEEEFNPQTYIEEIKTTEVGNLKTKIDQLDTDKKVKAILDHIKTNINKEEFKELRESAEIITKKIISKKSGKELEFTIGEETKIQDMSIKDNNFNLKVDDKNFQIPLDKIPKAVTGIDITKRGVLYKTTENGEVEITNPENNLIEKDDKLFIENYKGIDGKTHEIQVSFTQNGRVTFLENGEIEFSGGAVIYDPTTKTKIESKDKVGATGYVNFYKNGHIVKPYKGNNILVTKENEEITFEIKKTNENGAFIISQDGINKENYNDFPSNLDKPNSFFIDPENKNIFIAEDKNVIGFIDGTKDNGYKLFGVPGTPQGGIPLDKKLAFGGGQVFGTGKAPGTIPATGGGNNGGGSNGGGGILNSILPYLLIGGGILAAIIAFSASKDKKDTNQPQLTNSNQTKYKNGTSYSGERITYPEEKISTGRPATPKTPTIQSTFD